jgi:hypothetical protein
MTARRAAGPGPRTVALHRVLRSLAAIALGLGLVACGASTGSPAATTALQPRVTAAPSGAAGSGASPDASQPRWPGTTVLAVIALGGADGEIRKAGDDLQAAANAQDLKAMWGAADGLAQMIGQLMPNLDRLEVYDGTKPVAALYRKAFPELLAGATQLRDSITKGDAKGIVAGSQAIAQGLADYAPIREQIAGLVEQAILQQRLLVK